MNELSASNPDPNNARKYPVIPALIFMTMTSFTSINGTSPLVTHGTGVSRGTTGSAMNSEGLLFFIKQDLEGHAKKQGSRRNLAQSKGIQLPPNIFNLPDETIDFLKSQDIVPDFINPTEDCSLIIEFNTNSKHYTVEFFDDGDIVFLSKGATGIDVWDLTNKNFFDKLKSELLVEPQFEMVE